MRPKCTSTEWAGPPVPNDRATRSPWWGRRSRMTLTTSKNSWGSRSPVPGFPASCTTLHPLPAWWTGREADRVGGDAREAADIRDPPEAAQPTAVGPRRLGVLRPNTAVVAPIADGRPRFGVRFSDP